MCNRYKNSFTFNYGLCCYLIPCSPTESGHKYVHNFISYKTTLFSKYYSEVKWCPILTIFVSTKAVIKTKIMFFKSWNPDWQIISLQKCYTCFSLWTELIMFNVSCWTCIFFKFLVYAITWALNICTGTWVQDFFLSRFYQ